jgi:hypothetical protein
MHILGRSPQDGHTQAKTHDRIAKLEKKLNWLLIATVLGGIGAWLSLVYKHTL